MGKCRLMTLASAVVLAAASVCPPNSVSPVCGDTNGDCRVDVLDIQAVCDAAFAADAGPPLADVNGDDQTNVLDFQLIQARATAAAQEQRLPEDERPRNACPFADPLSSWLGLHHPVAILELAQSPRQPFPTPSGDRFRSEGSRKERYLYRLTPNAPPLYA